MKGPIFYAMARLACRRELRRQGYSFPQISEMMDAADDDVIDAAEAAAGGSMPVAAIGDGKVLDAVLDFLRSEQGQALIAALVKLLLTLLAA